MRACTCGRDNLNAGLIIFNGSFLTSTQALGFNQCIVGHWCPALRFKLCILKVLIIHVSLHFYIQITLLRCSNVSYGSSYSLIFLVERWLRFDQNHYCSKFFSKNWVHCGEGEHTCSFRSFLKGKTLWVWSYDSVSQLFICDDDDLQETIENIIR